MAVELNTGIYEIRNLINGKRYVGSAVDFGNRWRVHAQSLTRGDHHSRALQRAWVHYTPRAFQFNTLLACSKENLLLYEQICMDALKPEYNCAPVAGSQLGFKHSEESRKRMSDSRPKDFSPMTGKTHRAETRAKISASRMGKGGGPMSQERRAKIGAAHKGRIVTPEQRAKISATLMGHKQSPEQIEKRVLKLRGRKMPPGFAEARAEYMRGRKVSDETKIKMGKVRASLTDEQVREVRRLRTDGLTQRAIGLRMGVSQATIADICCGRKYKWVTP